MASDISHRSEMRLAMRGSTDQGLSAGPRTIKGKNKLTPTPHDFHSLLPMMPEPAAESVESQGLFDRLHYGKDCLYYLANEPFDRRHLGW